MSKAKNLRIEFAFSPIHLQQFLGRNPRQKTSLFIGDPGGGHQRLGLTFPRPTFQAPGSI
jgi:hypothetical protein